jgi:hypothetical protein
LCGTARDAFVRSSKNGVGRLSPSSHQPRSFDARRAKTPADGGPGAFGGSGPIDHTLFVCPHHDIGNADELPEGERLARQELEFHHHVDPAIPARQCFGNFGISLLDALGLPVRNRFGLRPAKLPDNSPAPLEIASALDRTGLMEGVTTFNLHPHLPHFERLGDSAAKLDVLARQPIDLNAPPHPFTAGGHRDFDALLQSKPGVFPGCLLICDTTTWSSTAGGIDSLQRFWKNVVLLKRGVE